MSDQNVSYGGQAVIEGVMIRGRSQATVAVHQPSGEIAYKHFPLDEQRRSRLDRVPLVRGIVLLWDMLNLGIRALNFSVSAASGEQKEISRGTSVLSLIFALLITVGLFFVLPMLLASGTASLGASLLLRESIEGVIRVILIVGYIVVIGRMPEIQRLFGYHGAEHKVVNAYEAGTPLTVDHVRTCSTLHPRCGTGFLVVVVLISFVVFALLGGLPFWARLLSRVVLVPLIAALAYEYIRFAAQHYHRSWVRILMAPSLALQHLTTRTPDDTMIETAIASLKAVLVADGVQVRDVPNEEPMLIASM